MHKRILQYLFFITKTFNIKWDSTKNTTGKWEKGSLQVKIKKPPYWILTLKVPDDFRFTGCEIVLY